MVHQVKSEGWRLFRHWELVVIVVVEDACMLNSHKKDEYGTKDGLQTNMAKQTRDKFAKFTETKCVSSRRMNILRPWHPSLFVSTPTQFIRYALVCGHQV